MRLPLNFKLTAKGGNVTALAQNCVQDAKGQKVLLSVRPGLSQVTVSAGAGNGLVCFSNELISVFGTSLGKSSSVDPLALLTDDVYDFTQSLP